MKFFVYIIKSKVDGKNYIGFSSGVEKRLIWHNLGKNVSTRCRRPFELIFQQEFGSKREALEYEYWLKKQKGGAKVKELIQDFNMPR